MPSKKIFCFSPWTNIDISPVGDITPCCKFQQKYYTHKLNIQTHSIEDYKNSEVLRDIKKDFDHNKWPVGCERCRIEEENNIASKRQLDYERWKQDYEQYNFTDQNFITGSVAFGNTCNLKCITCGPYSSSRWEKESRDLFGKTVSHFKFYKKQFVEEFISHAPEIIHLDIPGGEPFLSGVDEQVAMLEHYVKSGQSGKISLHYTTNATIFPEPHWWQLWQYFKNIDIQISVDGIEQRYEYIRFPAQWTNTVQNINMYLKKQDQIENLMLSVSHTVSAYSIYYLDEFFAWCYNIGLPRPWLGRVHNPAHMRPEVWPYEAKQKILTKLSESKDPDVGVWRDLVAARDESQYFDQFRSAVRQHDAYRGTDFDHTFSEMAPYL
jgi:MoaA/NifB/PqqE/SkfB family radical SAM enzyme